MLRIVLYSLFGSASAICGMSIAGLLKYGRDAPNIFRPQKGNEGFVIGLLAVVSAAFSAMLAYIDVMLRR